MSTFFVLLFLGSLGFLMWGLISPKSLSKGSKKELTRKDAGIGFGVMAVFFFVMVGITAPDKPVNKTDAAAAPSLVAKNESQVKAAVTQPTFKMETVTEKQDVPFESKTVPDSPLAKGTTKVTTKGVNGVKTLTYEVTKTDGKQTDKKLIKEEVTTPPVTEVTAIGTKVIAAAPKPTTTSTAPAPSSNCSPHYRGACVPIASDVDCAGGSGNGPAFVKGPVYIVDYDIYGLDGNDNDGIGCE